MDSVELTFHESLWRTKFKQAPSVNLYMKWYSQNKISLFLIFGSLMLLLIFLLFWLNSVYEEEEKALQKETDFMFVSDIREIEDTYLKEWLMPLQAGLMDNKMPEKNEEFKIKQTGNNSKEFSIIEVEHPLHSSIDTMKQMIVRSKVNDGEYKKVEGSLSMFISMGGDSLGHFMNLGNKDTSNIVRLIYDRFANSIKDAEIKVDYHINEVASDSLITKEAIFSQYDDVYNDRSYVLRLENYQNLLWRKMLPQILFSILLFSCISLAFFMVFQSLEKQRKLTELKNDFISNITHELKTPITTVGVAIEALSNFDAIKNPERTKEYLSISKHELHRLSILVDKVLKMSLFEKGEPELKLEMIDLKKLTQEILNSMKLQFDKSAAEVQFKSLGNNFYVKGDRVHLTSVLYNLIDNALKYSFGKPQVDIDLNVSDQGLKLIVTDQGIGIDPVYKNRIFDKFFRVPSGNEHNIKGYGLGLSYVASVIQKHEGSIQVKSDLGEGTSFTILLPQKNQLLNIK